MMVGKRLNKEKYITKASLIDNNLNPTEINVIDPTKKKFFYSANECLKNAR